MDQEGRDKKPGYRSHKSIVGIIIRNRRLRVEREDNDSYNLVKHEI
jgi:hypothetical protein